MSTRIVGGERRGATLRTPRGEKTRPTLARVRKSLFTILAPVLPGARVLDAFAGCGALGLEALSRGAREVVFVEKSRSALEALRANILHLDWDDRATVEQRNALSWFQDPGGESAPFDLIFLDPPYSQDLIHRSLELLGVHHEQMLARDGIVVAQAGIRDRIDETYGPLIQVRSRVYGETRIAFHELAD